MTRARFVLGKAQLKERFDAVRKAVISAARDAAGLGCDRILTSGQAACAEMGVDALRLLCCEVGKEVVVVAAAGVREGNVEMIVRDTGVRGVHAGSAVTSRRWGQRERGGGGGGEGGDCVFVVHAASMGSGGREDDMSWMEVDEDKARRYVCNAERGFRSRREG